MVFSVITKNFNCEILTRNLVTFKRWVRVKDENFSYYEGSLENPIFRGGFTKNQYIGGNCLKGEGLGQFADLRGGDTPIHTMGEWVIL